MIFILTYNVFESQYVVFIFLAIHLYEIILIHYKADSVKTIPSPNCISNGFNPKDDFLELIKSVGYVLKFKRFYTIFEIGEGIAFIIYFYRKSARKPLSI